MMKVIVRRSEKLTGRISAPPSKAYTHRMMIAALLSQGSTEIHHPLSSEDTNATLHAIRSFGAKVVSRQDSLIIKGLRRPKTPREPIDCGESGSTLRFMIPVASLAAKPSQLNSGPSLSRRPILPLLHSLEQLGAKSTIIREKKNSFDQNLWRRNKGRENDHAW